MIDLSFATIRELKEKLNKKEVSPEEVLEFYINRFNKYDSKLDTAIEVFDKDSILKSSKKEGSFYGIPGLIKDNICQQGRKLTCGSKILQNYQSVYDATVISKLKDSGALMIGRAQMDEFAMGSSGEYSAFKKTKNPWNTNLVPGGSSSGSIASVAAGFVPWALGSETGGSVRQPAALCGIVGLKPTYGLVSRSGLVAYASSLDQIGVATKTVYDNALILNLIAGKDPKDSTTKDNRNVDYSKNLTGKLKENFTIGVITNTLDVDGFDSEVYDALQESLKVYEKLGAKIKKIKLPMLEHGAAVYFIISRAEAASNLARFDGVRYGFRSKEADTLDHMYSHTRYEGFGEEVKFRILVGNYVLSAGHADEYYKSAKLVQGLMRDEFLQAFKEVDVLFSPVSPIPAFKFGAYEDNKLQLDLQDYFTCTMNLTGIPALAVPCGFTKSNLPIGFQLIGPDFSEAELYQAAYAYEQANNWYKIYPKL